MSATLNQITGIKNELNKVVGLRREALAKIDTHTRSIQELTTALAAAKTASPPDEFKVYDLETQIAQLQTIIETLRFNNQNNVYDIDAQLTREQEEKYSIFSAVFRDVKPGTITQGATQNPVKVSHIELDYIQCRHKALQFETGTKSKLILYPTIVLVQDEEDSFFIVPLTELKIDFGKKDPQQPPASDKVQQENTPVQLSIPAMYEEVFSFTEKELAEQFESTFTAYISVLENLNSEPLEGIKKEYFESVSGFGNAFFEFVKSLSVNEEFLAYTGSLNPGDPFYTATKNIATLGMVDLLKCFNAIADIENTTSNESFSMIFLQAKLNGIKIEKYEDVVQLNNKKNLNYYKDLLNSVAEELRETADPEKPFFILAGLLQHFDKDLHKEYVNLLYRYANIVIHADGRVTRTEEDALRTLLLSAHETSEAIGLTQEQEEKKAETLEQLLYELYDLTGLQTVKREINTLINVIKIQKARKEFDLKNTDMSLHLVFSGNPGTGKTTVARHLAKIYKCLGVLKKGHLVETDRSGLIAEYVGQTAIKVNKLVDSALNGVLFIDEAYAMMIDDKDTYGKEAIATLLKRMEDDRDKLIVILAGYTGEMATFISSNPGLKSRFSKYIFFPDYTPDELYSIFIGMSRKLDFVLEPKLVDKLKLCFLEEIEKGDPSFGNGRFARNLFEKIIENQANRLAEDGELNKEKLTLLREIDLEHR